MKKLNNVEVPKKVKGQWEKPPEEWNYNERRGYFYNHLQKYGYLKRTEREYAMMFDISQSTINRDIRKAKKFIAENLDGDEVKAEVEKLGETTIQNLMEKDEDFKAFQILEKKTKLLQDFGVAEKKAEEYDLGGDVTISIGSTPEEDDED